MSLPRLVSGVIVTFLLHSAVMFATQTASCTFDTFSAPSGYTLSTVDGVGDDGTVVGQLLDNKTLKSQTCLLERSVQPSGHEIITHPKVHSAHDDVSCAVAGCMVLASAKMPLFAADSTWISGADSTQSEAAQRKEESDGNARWQMSRMLRANGF